ncbi:hypothetical protein EYR36_009981 [Pleurotus pulmonarius]|nr:hypothetical protein EYR36_009981 [Pleurotus pulmonarius]
MKRYFSRDLEDGDWVRFDVYASRVHTLRFSCTGFRQSVFSEIALGRHRVDFLPNLAALYSPPSNTSVLPLFAHASELDVHIDFPTAVEWLPIASHARALRSLKILSPLNESGADYLPLTNLIGSLCTGLESLELARAGVATAENAIPADQRCRLESSTNLKALHLCAFDAPSPFELECLLEPLPKLESPSISGGLRKTPLYSLAVISRRCKNLTDLELDVDTTPRPLHYQITLITADLPSQFSFSRAISEVDWDRFDRYSSKVYSLRFTQRYDPSVFKEIAVGRRRLDFLPNLTTLYNARPTALFAYPRLKHLIIREESFTSKEVIEWLTLIEHRMPYIERLYINPESLPSPDVLPAFTSTLRRATFLKELDVPTGYLNNSNIPILASMPNLQRICSHHRSWPATNFNARSLFELPGDPFRSLQEFSANLDFDTATAYVPELNCFQGLRVLKIASHARESPEAYIALIDVIAQHCPGLTVLSLERRSAVLSSDEYDLAYGHHVQNMLKSLRHLESLTLRRFGVRGRMPLRDFALFAPHSKALKLLRIDIDSGLISSEPPYPFSALKRLHYESYSTLRTDPKEVACFLSRILPPNCKITSNEISNPELYESFQVVITWVPILIKARMEGRRAAVWDQ